VRNSSSKVKRNQQQHLGHPAQQLLQQLTVPLLPAARLARSLRHQRWRSQIAAALRQHQQMLQSTVACPQSQLLRQHLQLLSRLHRAALALQLVLRALAPIAVLRQQSALQQLLVVMMPMS
jgi:hypothetical protein